MFSVGEKVICIDDSIRTEHIISAVEYYQNWVQKGKEYTIRELLSNDGIVDGVLLEEVVNKPIAIKLLGGRIQEPAFGLFRFAKSQTTSIKEEIYERETVRI